MSDDGADKPRKRRSLRVPVDEVPRPTAPPEDPVTAAASPSEYDGTATVEMPAFVDDDDGLVASWMTPSTGSSRNTLASPPPVDATPSEADEAAQDAQTEEPSDDAPDAARADAAQADAAQADAAQADAAQADAAQADTAQADTAQADTAQADAVQADAVQADAAQADAAQADAAQADAVDPAAAVESDPVSLASVEVELDSGLRALEDEETTAVGAESPAEPAAPIADIDPDVVPTEAGDPTGTDSGSPVSVEGDSPEPASQPVAVVSQVVVQRVVSVSVGEPSPTPPERQEPEPEFEEPDIIVDDEYDADSDDFDDVGLDSEYDEDEFDSEPDDTSLESEETSLASDEVELEEPDSQEITVEHGDDDDDPILTSDEGEDEEDDDEPSLETSEITEEELAEELPEEEGELEELEFDESARSAEEGESSNKPPAPPDKQKAPPPPPKSAKAAAPPAAAAEKAAPRRKKARKKWFEELFNDDYLRTVPVPHPKTIVRQCDFIEQRFGLAPGATILDVGCGLGLHAVELTRRGYLVVGLDLSLPMLSRAADEAQSEGFKINFLHADMREMNFEGAFDAVLCWNTTLGYFDDETNKQIIERLYKALKPRGLLLLDVVNRDYVIQGQPNLVWFEGDGCVVMEETKMNYITSRLEVKRTVILDNGRQRDSLYTLRLYSVHELGQMLHHKGFRVVELTGREAHPGVFFGSASPRLIILAERRASTPARPSVSPPSTTVESTPPPKPSEAEGGDPAPTE